MSSILPKVCPGPGWKANGSALETKPSFLRQGTVGRQEWTDPVRMLAPILPVVCMLLSTIHAPRHDSIGEKSPAPATISTILLSANTTCNCDAGSLFRYHRV